MIWKNIRVSVVVLCALTILTGVLYPLLVTVVAQMVFPRQANGSLIQKNGRVLGSELVGQPFSDPKYFWSRPSATTPFPYNAALSTGSNLGPLNPALLDAVQQRVKDLKNADSLNIRPVPVDLITSSGSGLDPHISVASALYQLERVARVRGLDVEEVRALIGQCTEGRTIGLLGEPRVNVLELNLALDEREKEGR